MSYPIPRMSDHHLGYRRMSVVTLESAAVLTKGCKMRLLIIELGAAMMASVSMAAISSEIPDDERLRWYCILGSIAGSLAYINLAKLYATDGVAATIFGNFLLGFIFGPLACETLCPLMTIRISFSSCVAISGGIGLAAPWLYSTFLPAIGKKILAAVKGMSFKAAILRLFNATSKDDK